MSSGGFTPTPDGNWYPTVTPASSVPQSEGELGTTGRASEGVAATARASSFVAAQQSLSERAPHPGPTTYLDAEPLRQMMIGISAMTLGIQKMRNAKFYPLIRIQQTSGSYPMVILFHGIWLSGQKVPNSLPRPGNKRTCEF